MSDARVARVALPWLREAIDAARHAGAPPVLPSLGWLVGRGQTTPAVQVDWREWLVSGAGPLATERLRCWPAGPSLAAAAGVGGGTAAVWAVAQPVHLVAGMEHLRMAPLDAAVPSAAETQRLAATLREHFADDALDFVHFVEGVWLVRCGEPIDCVTHDPAAVVGRDVHDFLPAGKNGARVRSLMNEIQMVLHEHPVNEARARAGTPAVNTLWLWGFGTLDAVPTPLAGLRGWTLRADDLWLRAYWRVQGGVESALAAGSVDDESDVLVAMTQPLADEAPAALVEVDAGLLSSLRRAVQSGGLRRLDIHDGARVHALDACARLRFWRRPVVAAGL